MNKEASPGTYVTVFRELGKLIATGVLVVLILCLIGQVVHRYRNLAARFLTELETRTRQVSDLRELSPSVRRAAANDAFSKSRFPHNWAEFQETLHDRHVDADGEPVISRSRATVPASHHFAHQSIVDTPLMTEYFRHIPGILTGLDIIGTFCSLILDLSGFDRTTPEQVQQSVNGLIRDVMSAFIGSLVAIVSAMVITYFEKHWLRIWAGAGRLRFLPDHGKQWFDHV